ncbi:MAG: hypothetical protein HY672_00770 [Chloroflexi bacterium]|nr:hypothetical protein [Chloroflexota bacterium]
MKTKGRFIAILAILGLLVALIPIFPVAAATGTAALSGGVTGLGTDTKTYFSDRTGFNIVTATITDEDLSAVRTGKARYNVAAGVVAADGASPDPFTLKATGGNTYGVPVLGGEKAQSDKKSGTGTTTAFTLTKTPRDADDDGVLESGSTDDVKVTVNGVALAATGYTINFATGVVTLTTAPATGTDNVVFDYEISEFDQTTPANTPLRFDGTSVKYGATLPTALNQVGVATTNATDGSVTTAIDVPATQVVVITFAYDVKDSKTSLIVLSTPTSASLGKNRTLTGAETTAVSNAFANSVALFSPSDLSKIESEAADTGNDTAAACGDSDGTVQIDELNCTAGLATALVDAAGTALNARVQTAAGSLGLTASSASASTFVSRALPVSNGENLTVTYQDASPAATITNTTLAVIDLAAPTVTLVSPTQSLYTNIATQQMLARAADAGVGLNSADITFVAPAGCTPATPSLTTTGYDLSCSPGSALAEGLKEWYIQLKDRVGNEPYNTDDPATTANEGTLGAAPVAAVAVNKFKFTVDTAKPTILSAATGYYLKNPGVTSGTSAESQDGDNRNWVRAIFDLGTGGAPLDASSVVANDFRVAGVAPISAVVNVKSQESGAIPAGAAVYLEVAQQATDAKPKVEVVGEILDKAGNIQTAGSITNATDKLTPILTVTAAPTYAPLTVTLTITSSETLGVNPTLNTVTTAPTCATPLPSPTPQTVGAVTSTSWTATFTNTTGGASKQWAVVTGNDVAGNSSTVGDACVAAVAASTDVVTFQVDNAAPVKAFPAATATATAGPVWIVARYDEFEYTGDTNTAVTVVTATLNGTSVASEVFIGSTTVDEAGTALGETHATVTLAKTLEVGTYTYVLVVKDAALNSSTSFTHTLTVSAKPKFEIVLNPGVNLVSIPGAVVGDGANINNALKDLPVTAVLTYDANLNKTGKNPWLSSTLDAATSTFKGDITVLEPGKAYFVTASARATMKLDLVTVGTTLPPIVQVLQGFNAVGFWSIQGSLSTTTTVDADAYLGSTKWSVAYTYDPTPGIGWMVIRPDSPSSATYLTAGPTIKAGQGLLVFFTQDGTLTP